MKEQEYWQKQTDEPLFPDLMWSRPETARARGKLLIIGGQAQEFAHVAAAYMAAEAAGAGTIRVIMPDSTAKVTRMLPNMEYAPSNPSGSFSRRALADFLEASQWADHVLLAGDLGKNSETTTILDGYLLKCPAPVTISQNALHSIGLHTSQLLQRPATLVMDSRGLQTLATDLELIRPILSGTTRPVLADILHGITGKSQGAIVAQHGEHWWVSAHGRVSSTPVHQTDIVVASAHAAVWAMQHPIKKYESLVSSLFSEK